MRSLFAVLSQRYRPVSRDRRRDFLKATLAASAGALLSDGPAHAHSPAPRHVVVIGAGFAGLACAYELKSAGYKVTVVEARNRVGGRVLSFPDFAKGKNVEGGGELVGSNHPTWVAYKEKFGLEFLDVTEEDGSMPVLLGGKLLTDEQIEKMYEDLDAALNTMNADAAEIDVDEPWKSPNAEALDKRPLSDWVAKVELDDLSRQLLDIQLASDNAVPNDKASYLALLATVKAGGMEKYWTESEVYRCAGGNQQLAFKLAEAIGADNLRLRLPVREIVADDDKVTVTCADSREIEADDVVLAAPPGTWAKIKTTPDVSERLQTQMGKAVKYLAAVKSRYWRTGGQAPDALSDTFISQVWEGTDNQAKDETDTSACQVGFSGGAQAEQALALGRNERDTKYAETMEKLFPGYKENVGEVRFMDWPRDPLTLAGYSFPAPGQVTALGPTYYNGLGRLHFAGEHTCYKFVGYMEGGLNSGASLAKRIAQRDGAAK